MKNEIDLYQYSKAMSEVRLPLWNDLPEFAVYADQLLQIVNNELSFMPNGDEKLITKSMVNNYVKWGMIPKPVKKKYDRLHIACVIVITILKQVLPITEIKDGIQLQIKLHGNERAYDTFCEAFEESMKKVFSPILEKQEPYMLEARKIEYDELAVSAITLALSNKLLTEKIIMTKIKKITDSDKVEG